ncbi:MAG: M23 family metallopeptidase [Pseudomonadota bacterium]
MIVLRDVVFWLTSLWFAGLAPAAANSDAAPVISCDGIMVQGGIAICHTDPGAAVSTPDGAILIADEAGKAVIGLRRDAPESLVLTASTPAGLAETTLSVAPRRDERTVVRGASCDKIDARTDEQKAHAARSWEKKQAGWAAIRPGDGPANGFIEPAEGRMSSPFGFTRRYVTVGCPEKERPHLGYDIAAPVGAPIIAPAAGEVILAEEDLYYEGGTVFLDHGHGLVSIFLHMSKLDVAMGDVVAAGEKLGEIGATGRVTGPHLHWGVKWRNPSTDDRSGDFYIDPALLLQLPRAP